MKRMLFIFLLVFTIICMAACSDEEEMSFHGMSIDLPDGYEKQDDSSKDFLNYMKKTSKAIKGNLVLLREDKKVDLFDFDDVKSYAKALTKRTDTENLTISGRDVNGLSGWLFTGDSAVEENYSFSYFVFESGKDIFSISLLYSDKYTSELDDFYTSLLTLSGTPIDAAKKDSLNYFYSNANDVDILSGSNEVIGTYSSLSVSSSECTDENLCEWYFGYVLPHKNDLQYCLIEYADKPGYGIYASENYIEKDVKIKDGQVYSNGVIYTVDNDSFSINKK